MTQLRGPTALYDVARRVLSDIFIELATTDVGAPSRACVVPGLVAWDQCDCDGLLAVSLTRAFLSDDFPTGALGRGSIRLSPCDLPWLVGEFTITVLRCAPQPKERALAPSCEALDAAARVLTSDAYVVLTETVSTLCELKSADEVVDYVIGDQETRGPDGACVGSDLVALVAVER